MITTSLITAILAALTGMVPGVLQFFTQKASNAQALAIEQLRQQAAKDGVALQVDLANSQSDIQQQQHLYAFAGAPTGIGWIDGLTALVRPVVTFVMFDIWVVIEITLLVDGWKRGYDLEKLGALVWTPENAAIFAAIIGFWFGNRMLVRSNQQMAATRAVTSPPVPKVSIALTPPAAPRTGGTIPEPPGSRT